MSTTSTEIAISHMQETLNMLQEELEATNREVLLLTLELEQRVEERTAQLSQANQELRQQVAERLRAEQEIIQLNRDLERRAELLQAANEELEAFSASVSHDLRNPLTRVLGFATLLSDSAGARLQEKEAAYLNRITTAGTQMVALIDALLRLASAAKTELAGTKVNLNEMVDRVIAEMEQETQGRAIVWKRSELPVVTADASLLKQVFVNLISNAVKYTRPRDPAEIEIAALAPTDQEWVLTVRDNGVGFEPQQATKLFGAFQRLHRKDEFEGSGVGLANVRRIVLRHGGRVWAESQPGAGAAFFFSLPIRD
jgi:light-regulated signal transduction histidine kinase (bacteriophytochrome)